MSRRKIEWLHKNTSLFTIGNICLFAVSSLHCEVRGALFYNPPKKRNLIKPIMSQPAFSPQKENMYKYEGLSKLK